MSAYREQQVGAVSLSQHLLTGHLPQTGPENALSATSVLVSDVVVSPRWLLSQDLTEANRVGLWCRQASVHPSSTSGKKIQDTPPTPFRPHLHQGGHSVQ